MNEDNSQSGKILRTIGVLFLLVVLPAGSWYYLKTGFQYQKDVWAQLKRYGEISDYQLTTQEGDPFTKELTKKHILLASFLSPTGTETSLAFKQLKRLHFQFDDRKDLFFMIHSLDGSRTNADELRQILIEDGLEDDPQCLFLSGEAIPSLLLNDYKRPTMEPKADTAAYKLVVDQQLPVSYPYFVLIDTKGMIRNYYDFREEAQIKRLVEHLAVILPREKRSTIEVKREKEK